jgi:sugar phosphate isomerase/epimerase
MEGENMNRTDISRRIFLRNVGSTAAVSAAFAASPAGWAAAPPKAMRLGGPIFVKSTDPGELARAHRALGYRAAYAPQVSLTDKDHIQAIIKEFAAQDVTLAEVGGWKNLLDPDSEKRRKNLEYVTERLALAEELGARCCVNIAGSYNPDIWYGPHPDNLSPRCFEATVESVRKLIDAVKPRRTTYAIEMVGWCLPNGPDTYLKLIKAVDRKAFAAHVDVCNVMNSPERIYTNSAVIRDCFAKLGPWIVSCHAKDLAWQVEMQVHFIEVIPGRGVIDLKTYVQEIAKLPADVPLMLEHLKTEEDYTEGRHYYQRVARETGLSFGDEST